MSAMRYALTWLLVMAASCVWAQSRFGVKGGINYSRLLAEYSQPPGSSYSGIPDESSLGISYAAGFFFNAASKNKASLRLELLYADRHTSTTYDYTQTSGSAQRHYAGEVDYWLRYLQLPVLLDARLSKRLGVIMGVNAGLLISSRSLDVGVLTETGSQFGNPTTQVKEYEERTRDSKDLKKMAFGPVMGFNYHIADRIQADLRFVYDMNDISISNYSTAHTSEFQFTLGYVLFGATTGPETP